MFHSEKYLTLRSPARSYRAAFLVLLPVLLSAPVFAQRDRDTYSSPSANALEIVGQVRIVGTGLPAERVPVRLERFGGGTIDQLDTDSTGRFRFANLSRGYYRVVVHTPGYHAVQQDADLQVVFRAYLVFELVEEKPGPTALVDVVDARVPAEARAEFMKARLAVARKTHREAVEHLQRALTVYPDFYEANLLLGSVFVDEREWQKAEDAFTRAVALKADSTAASLALGEVYWREKRFKEAEEVLLAGLKVDETAWNGYFTLARLYWDQGNIGKAAPAIGHTLQLKPDFAEAHLLAGNILLRVDQPQRALAEYQEYLRLEPKGEFAPQTRELVDKLSKAIVENKKSKN